MSTPTERQLAAASSGTATDLIMARERWEHGSFFHLSLEAGVMPEPWARHPHRFFASGREALRALVHLGLRRREWTRLLVPSYYCQEVVTPLAMDIPVEAYADAPTDAYTEPTPGRSGDLVVSAATFGRPPRPGPGTGPVMIEDHTHDPIAPAAWDSHAEFAFASLRKTLPLPDGGVIWSPQGRDLPSGADTSSSHDRSAHARLTAMVLKRHYLAGHAISKAEFRALADAAEAAVGAGEPSGMSTYSMARLPTFPGEEWRERRRRNLAVFREVVGTPPGLRHLDVPFAATMIFDDVERRERVRSVLMRSRVYATVYWPLTDGAIVGVPQEHLDLSRRILSVHCDFRYDAGDMARVGAIVGEALAST